MLSKLIKIFVVVFVLLVGGTYFAPKVNAIVCSCQNDNACFPGSARNCPAPCGGYDANGYCSESTLSCLSVDNNTNTCTYQGGTRRQCNCWANCCSYCGPGDCGTCNPATSWGAWSGCSAGCGGGTQSRTNSCDGSTETQACNTQACCDNSCGSVGSYCTTSGYTNGCGNWCTGTLTANCGAESNTHCSGTTYTSPNGCGSCAGTLGASCTNPATVCSGTAIASSTGCGTCPSGTKCDTPATPAASSPANAAEVAGLTTTLSWTMSSWAAACGSAGFYSYCVDGSCNTTAGTSVSYTGVGGNHSWTIGATNSCGAVGATSAASTFCLEAGPVVSAWGAWGACGGAHTRTRTRTCTENCSAGVADCSAYFAANCPAGSSCVTTGAGLAWTQTETQTCYGQMTGTFFDASDLAACPANPQLLAGNLKISGGTLTLSGPRTYGPYTTDATGLYTTVSTVLSPDTYNLTPDPGGNYVLTPKFNCQGATLALTGSAAGCGAQPCETAPTTTHDFGFWKVYGGWWQAKGGSVYGGQGLTSNIPGTVVAAKRYLIIQDANLQDGLAQYKSGSINLGTFPGVTVSVSNWQANSGYSGDDMDYNYFVAKMGSYATTNLNTVSPAWNAAREPDYSPSGTNDYQIYTYTGDVTLNWSPTAGRKEIFLIKGNVTVTSNVTVPTATATFLSVIASGTITFNSSVTNADGWYVANALNFPSGGGVDSQFVGNGSFIGWNGITLSRNQGVLNNTQPAELFVFRPDLMINAPTPMMQARYVWRWQ